MTSKELFNAISPDHTKVYTGQLLKDGLNVNTSDIFSLLIKDAARCNSYNSDVYYDLLKIDTAFSNFDPTKEFEPIWIGFRKLGVDGTSYLLSRLGPEDRQGNIWGILFHEYFALYSITVEPDGESFYKIKLNTYNV